MTSSASVYSDFEDVSEVMEMRRVPSTLLFYDDESASSFGSRSADSNYSYVNVAASLTSLTDEIDCCRYKMMGLVTADEALTQLDTYFAVLFHSKQDSRPLLLAVIYRGQRFLLRVAEKRYANGDRFWGVNSNRGQILTAFRDKETLLQYYALAPQAALMDYFHNH